jgi:hypothetical protein
MTEYVHTERGRWVLGGAYLLVGVLFAGSLVSGSLVLFGVFLLTTVGVMLVSIAVLFREEGVFTAENRRIAVFVLAALVLFAVLQTSTDLPPEVVFVVAMVVGTIPTLLPGNNDSDSSPG